MMNEDELAATVRSILLKHRDGTDDPISSDFPAEAPIFGPGGVITDSLEVLDALCEIEDALGVTIPDEDLTEELFSSVASLLDYLRGRLLVRKSG